MKTSIREPAQLWSHKAGEPTYPSALILESTRKPALHRLARPGSKQGVKATQSSVPENIWKHLGVQLERPPQSNRARPPLVSILPQSQERITTASKAALLNL